MKIHVDMIYYFNHNYRIDNLQYCNWSRKILKLIEAKLDAVHVTIVYHEDYKELLNEVKNVGKWPIENSIIFLGVPRYR